MNNQNDKVELIYDPKLDDDKELERQANYYDNADIEEAFDISKAVVNDPTTKRVNILIPTQIYKTASTIAKKTGIGYQNTLKTAMAIGLKHLAKEL